MVRVDSSTTKLSQRLAPGDIAIIDHTDLDRAAAEALVAARPDVVLNAAPSISGRYPNLGPSVLLEAGIPLVDDLGPDITRLREGQHVQVDLREDSATYGQVVRSNGTVLAVGRVQTPATIEQAMQEARAGLSTQIQAFAANTTEYMQDERDLLLNGVGIPQLRTDMAGRPVLVVVRGYRYKEELAHLRGYIREFKPVIVAVDAGADAVLQAGYKPDVIIGDMDAVSDKALRSGAEIVVRAYRDGRAPGVSRAQESGVEHVLFTANGATEDLALLLADAGGAELIITVGTQATLMDFLDKGREGMASTFLSRLKVGTRLVDAETVAQLYRAPIGAWPLVLLALVGLVALFVALAATPAGQSLLGISGPIWGDFFTNLFN